MKLSGRNTVVLDELARKCPFVINKGAGSSTPVWLICKQITEELELLKSFDYIVVDRSVLDAYCYNLVLHGNEICMRHYLPLIREHIEKYYYKVYIPNMIAFNFQTDDGVRDMDPEFRRKVYETILNTYMELHLNHAVISNVDCMYKDLGLL